MGKTKPSSGLTSRQKAILKVIERNPGITVTELALRFDLGWGSFYYHLERLRERKLIKGRRVGRRLYLQLAEAQAPRRIVLGKTARIIAVAIVQSPGCSMADLLATLPLTPRTLYYHVDRLREAKLITAGSKTRYTNLRPTAKLFEGLGLVAPRARRGPRKTR